MLPISITVVSNASVALLKFSSNPLMRLAHDLNPAPKYQLATIPLAHEFGGTFQI